MPVGSGEDAEEQTMRSPHSEDEDPEYAWSSDGGYDSRSESGFESGDDEDYDGESSFGESAIDWSALGAGSIDDLDVFDVV